MYKIEENKEGIMKRAAGFGCGQAMFLGEDWGFAGGTYQCVRIEAPATRPNLNVYGHGAFSGEQGS